MDSNSSEYLRPTPTIDCDHASVVEFAKAAVDETTEPSQRAAKLFYAVRDGIRYDPYKVKLSVDGLRASATLSAGRGWCVPKAVLLAACCRAMGIPARLGYADVQNHLSTERMRKLMKTDVFFWHGYTSMQLDGVWVKATPAFNVELCEKFRLKPLEFDGRNDALFHPFDCDGKRHMDYLRYHGEFPDVPIDRIADTFRREYSLPDSWGDGDFEFEIGQEFSDH